MRLLIAMSLAAAPAFAADTSFQCAEDRIARTGMNAAKVAQLCGEPAQASEHEEEVPVEPLPQDLALQQACVQQVVLLHGELGSCQLPQRTRRVMVEEWLYDLGPQNFVRKLRFEDGVLVRIHTGWYGKG
jgi:hypothetical protein